MIKLFFLLLIISLSALILFPFLGEVHLFDWDEAIFGEASREMLERGEYLQVRVNYEPFWEKPPFFFWCQVVSYKIFGVNEFAARFPSAIMGVLTAVGLFLFGTKVHSPKFGFLWGIFFLCSALPNIIYKMGLIDPTFNFFITLGLYSLFMATSLSKNTLSYLWGFLSAVSLGIATTTKGPVGIGLPLLSFFLYRVITRSFHISWLKLILYLIGVFCFSSIWYIIETVSHGSNFIKEFFLYQVRLLTTPYGGHPGPSYFHFLVFLIGCFPLSGFAILGMDWRKIKGNVQKKFHLLNLVWFWIILVIFSIVREKLIHYSSLLYLPGAFFATQELNKLKKGKIPFLEKLILSVAYLFWLGVGFTPLWLSQPELILPYIKSEFLRACLKTPDVVWSFSDFLPVTLFGVLGIIGLISLWRNKLKVGLVTLFLATPLFINSMWGKVLPKIEEYLQGPPVRWYLQLKTKKCDILTFYKSYLGMFYTQRLIYPTSTCSALEVIRKKRTKPLYIVTRYPEKEVLLKKFPYLETVETRGGFCLLKCE